MTRKAVLALTFDNMGSAQAVGNRKIGAPGPDDIGPAGYPEVIALLAELDLKATFFLEGWNALHNPDAVRRLVDNGHEVAIHGWAHEPIGSLEAVDVERVLTDAFAAFRRIGIVPQGFRAPGGQRGPYALPILRRLGFTYDSSVDHAFNDAKDALVPAPRLIDGDFPNLPWQWSSIDYYHYAMHPAGERTPEELRAAFITKLRRLEAEGGTQTFIFHAFVSCGTPDRENALRAVLEYAKNSSAIDVLTARGTVERLRAAGRI